MLKKILVIAATTFLLVGCAANQTAGGRGAQNGGAAASCDGTGSSGSCPAQAGDLPLN